MVEVLENRGLIHLYYGNGKGKTTCGMGLCLRAAGAGKKVLVHQFMKNNNSNERKILALIPNVELSSGQDVVKFTKRMTEEELCELKVHINEKFAEICAKVENGDYDLLFMDEALHIMNKGFLDEALMLDFLANKPLKLEVVLTGYNPSDAMMAATDYASEISKVKHPIDGGIRARRGIEF